MGVTNNYDRKEISLMSNLSLLFSNFNLDQSVSGVYDFAVPVVILDLVAIRLILYSSNSYSFIYESMIINFTFFERVCHEIRFYFASLFI